MTDCERGIDHTISWCLITAFSPPHCDVGDAWSAGYACPLLVLAVSKWSLCTTLSVGLCVHWRDHTRSETGPHDLTAAGWQAGPSRLNDNYSIRFEMKKNTTRTTLVASQTAWVVPVVTLSKVMAQSTEIVGYIARRFTSHKQSPIQVITKPGVGQSMFIETNALTTTPRHQQSLTDIMCTGSPTERGVIQHVEAPSIHTSKKRVKRHIAVNGTPISQLRDVTCHMGSHSVTCHPTQVNTHHFNPSQ